MLKLPVLYKSIYGSKRREVREQYIKEQSNKCMYCGGDLDIPPPEKVTSKKINWKLFPPNFLRYPVHLQHSHKTGLTEGVVHAYCNAVLWEYHGR